MTWVMTNYYNGRQSVGALFNDSIMAERAINALKGAGFPGDQIGVALRDRTERGELVEETGTRANEGAVSGAIGGGLLGGFIGFLVGVGALAIPGVGPVVSAGVLTSVLGTGVVAAVAGASVGLAAGGIVGALVGMGIPEEEAHYLDVGFRRGRVLVVVNAGDRIIEAAEILQQYGGDLGVSRTLLPTPRENRIV